MTTSTPTPEIIFGHHVIKGISQISGGPTLIISKPGRKAPVLNVRFSNEDQRDQYLVRWMASMEKKAEAKALKAEAKKKFMDAINEDHPFPVGTVLFESWGYSMTIVDFYQVTAVKGKQVTVRQISGTVIDGDGQSGRKIPVQGSFIGDPFKKLVQVSVTSGNAEFKPTYYTAGLHGSYLYKDEYGGKGHYFNHLD